MVGTAQVSLDSGEVYKMTLTDKETLMLVARRAGWSDVDIDGDRVKLTNEKGNTVTMKGNVVQKLLEGM